MTPSLLATDGVHLSQSGKGSSAEVSRDHRKSFKLDLKGERDKIRLTRDKSGGGTPVFEGWCASEVLWSAP